MRRQLRADQRGFTLAELLVSIAILGLVMTGLLTLLKKGNESYLAGANQVEAQAAVRAALQQMTQEVREAGYNPQGLPTCTPPLVPPACLNGIINPTPTTFTIQNDWNGSGVIEPGIPIPMAYTWGNVQRGEQITYSIVGGVLCRQESAVDPPATPPCPNGQPLITSVAQASIGGAPQPIFQYLDANDNVLGPPAGPVAAPDQIRTVLVTMQAGVQNQPPAIWQAGAIQVTMSDRIRLRNRIP